MENEDIEGTKYEAFIATRWKTITLDTPLSPDSDSLDANGAYICALEYPSIVTNEESNALKSVFEQLITEGLNEEENQYS